MKIAALFPGYGSQFVGMAKELYDESRLIQEHFEQASSCLNINFVKLCFASSDSDLAKIENAFPALFLVSSSIFDVLKQEGVQVDLVAGYDVGQYAAMHAANSLSLPDGLYLLNKYVDLYKKLVAQYDLGFIRVYGLPKKTVEQVCKKHNSKKTPVHIALYEATDTHVVVGDKKTVQVVANELIDLEGTTEFVGDAIGLHSSFMLPVQDGFTTYLPKVDFKDASTEFLCNVTLNHMKVGDDLRDCAISWITKPVVWADVVERLKDYDLLIQIGPGTQLRDTLSARYPEKKVISVNTSEDIEIVKEIIGIPRKEKIEEE